MRIFFKSQFSFKTNIKVDLFNCSFVLIIIFLIDIIFSGNVLFKFYGIVLSAGLVLFNITLFFALVRKRAMVAVFGMFRNLFNKLLRLNSKRNSDDNYFMISLNQNPHCYE